MRENMNALFVQNFFGSSIINTVLFPELHKFSHINDTRANFFSIFLFAKPFSSCDVPRTFLFNHKGYSQGQHTSKRRKLLKIQLKNKNFNISKKHR